MANINFPAITAGAYRGNISEFRNTLRSLRAFLHDSAQATPEVIAQWNAFLLEAAPTYATVVDDQAIVTAVSGTYTDTATVTVAGGVVTAVVLS